MEGPRGFYDETLPIKPIMKFKTATFTLSVTDLVNHLSCKHLTQLNQSLAKGKIAPPSWRDPDRDRLRELGMAHEKAFVGHLRNKGLQTSKLRDEEGENAVERTMAAMRQGKDVIVQAALQAEQWHGRADILYRIDEPCELGNWSYEVIDKVLTKHYGFTEEELDFIINYDIKYRMGKELEKA